MRNPPPNASKTVWREWAFERRRGVQGDPGAVTENLRAFLKARGVTRVLAYHALPGEADLSSLATDFELFTTRTRFQPQRHLTVHPWKTATEVSRAGYLQPPAGAPKVNLESIEAALLPGLAYDLRGVRLGYGGGFYDRLLPTYTGLTVGVVWSTLLVPALPAQAHDCRVGWLATELGLRRAE